MRQVKAVDPVFRSLYRGIQWVHTLFRSNSGNWKWLRERQVPHAMLNRSFWRRAIPSTHFYIMLGLSGIICTLGLLADSAAVIIGAMIVTPLLDPVIALAFAMTVGNRRLMKRTLITVCTGVLLAIASAAVLTQLVGIQDLGNEILSRTRPHVLHLAVAIAAGAAGGFANTRSRVSSALPGVAISVALLPPLNVIGICLALGLESDGVAAFLMFSTNLIGILFGASLIFLLEGYGSLNRARHGLLVSTIVMSVLGLPLGWSFRSLLIEERTRQQVTHLVHRYEPLTKTSVEEIQVHSGGGPIQIRLQVSNPGNPLPQTLVSDLKTFFEDELSQSVSLQIDVIPIQRHTLLSET